MIELCSTLVLVIAAYHSYFEMAVLIFLDNHRYDTSGCGRLVTEE